MRPEPVHGILNIDKPYGITSMDVVRRVKRASKLKRVGHGGTLDPIATGVIPVCIGQATRVMEYLLDGVKSYRAVIELGVTTDTYDAVGQVIDEQDTAHLTSDDIEQALESFKGVTQQVPPMYSALKRGGKRLYELARAGIEVELEPRRVEVFDIRLLEWTCPLATVEVSCGRGFYMRSCAYDLGRAVGCGGHLKSLVRLRSGPFEIADALSLEDAEEMFSDGTFEDPLYPPDVVLYKWRSVIVGKRLADDISHGNAIAPVFRVPPSRPDERCRVYGLDGRFLAVLRFDASAGQWRPEKVFR